jgi:hypothetical protein
MQRLRRRRADRRNSERAADVAKQRQVGDFDGAMFVVRQALTDLEIARRKMGSAMAVREAHARIDAGLERAAAAASAVFNMLFDGAGGVHHAETDPEVMVWKRRLNTALTLRSQHQMAQGDDEASLPITGARAATRAAYGPHQAGMEFDTDPTAELPRAAGSTAGGARTGTGIDLDATLGRAPVAH